MSLEDEVQKKMSGFYKNTLSKLPVIPERPPFEIKVIEQKTEASRFAESRVIPSIEDEQANVGAPPPPGITSVNPNTVSNAGGTTVTITGSDFVEGSTVRIAGISASGVSFVNSSTITCTTPADGLGWMSVEVTNPSGQTVTLNNAIQYVNFPDNFVLSGPHTVAGYQGCALGEPYTFTVTARIGSQNFTPSAGVTVYAWIGVYQDAGSCGLESPFPVTLNSGTGASVTRTIAFAVRAVTPGVLGTAAVLLAVWASNNGTVGSRYPTYGDVNYQPTAFRVDISGNAPPPGPPTGGGEFFSWSGVNPNTGHTNPWGWDPGETIHSHPITLKRLTSGGAVVTSYSGTATIKLVQDSGSGQFNIAYPMSVTFSSGQITFGVIASYNYSDAHGSQAYGYFHFVATDGTVSNPSPQCAVLNHL